MRGWEGPRLWTFWRHDKSLAPAGIQTPWPSPYTDYAIPAPLKCGRQSISDRSTGYAHIPYIFRFLEIQNMTKVDCQIKILMTLNFQHP
jgi:hypothetical protein